MSIRGCAVALGRNVRNALTMSRRHFNQSGHVIAIPPRRRQSKAAMMCHGLFMLAAWLGPIMYSQSHLRDWRIYYEELAKQQAQEAKGGVEVGEDGEECRGNVGGEDEECGAEVGGEDEECGVEVGGIDEECGQVVGEDEECGEEEEVTMCTCSEECTKWREEKCS